MPSSTKFLSAMVFLAVIAVSIILFVYPEFVYDILILVIESFQAGGLPLLFVMMVIQAIAIPIPSELVLIAGGLAFPFPSGWLVGALGSIVAAIVSFYISKKGGRGFAIKLVGEKAIHFADNWFNRWGGWAILQCRLDDNEIEEVPDSDCNRHVASNSVLHLFGYIFWFLIPRAYRCLQGYGRNSC
jgi:uncharacterized membrane protein YdjX (TVP38/TMEM64 family)